MKLLEHFMKRKVRIYDRKIVKWKDYKCLFIRCIDKKYLIR